MGADDTPRRAGFLERRGGWIVAVAGLAAATLILYVGRGTSFFLDEWWFIARRRGGGIDSFLDSHNGHLTAIPVAVYKILLATVGLRSYVPYRVVLVGFHLLTCALLFVYLRRRAPAVYAVAATVLMLFLGHAWEDLLWAFQITFLLSAATGIAALLLLDRRDRAGDVGAMVAVAASIASGGIGLVFAGGVLVELLWTRRDQRRLWIVGVPLAAYAVWQLAYGGADGSLENFSHLVSFTNTLAGDAGRALVGTSVLAGAAVAAVVVAVVVQVVRTWPISGRFANTIAMPLGFWALLTYSRGDFGVGNRYTYLSVLFLILVGAEVVAKAPSARALPRPVVVVGAAALVLVLSFSVIDNVRAFSDGRSVLTGFAARDGARFSALMLASDRAARDAAIFRPTSGPKAGGIIDALTELDFPTLDADALLAQREDAREEADNTIALALGRVVDVGSDATGDPTARDFTVEGSAGTLQQDGACLTLTAGGPSGDVTLTGDTIHARVTASADAPVEVSARSLADAFREPIATIAPGTTRDITFAANGIRPWLLRLSTTGTLQACDRPR
ncbi:MAG TPA: hypothetical protein VFZ17_09050 [Acidimicrobiia bacterium]|nr:hypothetical protein [Acidimicrobiia bacterium]